MADPSKRLTTSTTKKRLNFNLSLKGIGKHPIGFSAYQLSEDLKSMTTSISPVVSSSINWLRAISQLL
jgi:hypothetical protein